MSYTVFIRNWWKRASTPGWPKGLEPDPRARKTVLATGLSYEEARQVAKEFNDTHKPGKLSRKAEIMEGSL